jgi:radical SAM superfamily enzyme YgiQ (UPF0313 family)
MVKKIEQKNYDLSSVKGIGFKNQEKIIVNDDWQIVSNLDSIPLPGRELLSSEISYTSEDMGVIMSSRGCPFKCSFCSHIVRTRYHPVDRVIEEIKKVIDKYGTSHFSFKDDSFTVNRNRTLEFCNRLVEEKLGMYYKGRLD